MQIIQNTIDFRIPDRTAVAIGKFDGIHKGHMLLLNEILKAKEKGLKAAVFTFDPSPNVFFGEKECKEITTLKEKRDYFEKLGIDYLVEYPFNKETAGVDPVDYVKRFLLEYMHAKLIVAGEDVSFGKYGAGDAKLLKTIAKEHACQVKILQKIKYGEQIISSSLVRELIEAGKMEEVTQLLGEPYSVCGKVLHGNEIGRTIGFPTLNVMPAESKVLPPNGVYFSDILLNDKLYHGVSNIGNKPTVGVGYQKGIETFVYEFHQNVYDQEVKIFLRQFVRKECKFRDFAELQDAIAKNVLQGKIYFGIES